MIQRYSEQNISQPSSLLIQIIPTTICMLGNTILILINVYHNKRSVNEMFGMGLGTIFSNITGYLLISSLNIGLACEIAKAHSKKRYRIIGIYYQRALVVNFIACIILITPLLYISNKILRYYKDLASYDILNTTSEYLFQLVPSIYAFAFFDTTRVFLQSQNVRIPPMLILLIAIFFHFAVSKILIQSISSKGMGAAWAKNFTDIICSISIYLYIVYSNIVKNTWIEWDIQCLTNWGRHLKNFTIIGFTTYLEALMFLIFSLFGSSLQQEALTAHIGFVNWAQIFFLVFLGLKQGILTQISQLIMQDQFKQAQQKVKFGIKSTFILSFVVNTFMIIYQKEVSEFFINSNNLKSLNHFNTNYWIFIISNFLDDIQISIAGILKGIDNDNPIIKINLVCYTLGLFLSYYLSENLRGLWIGWSFGLFLNLIFCLYFLKQKLNKWNKIQEMGNQDQGNKIT